MTPEQIIAAYNQNPDLTLRTFSRFCGWSVRELKTLLQDC